MKDNNDSRIMRRFASKGVFPHQFAFTLLIPFRNLFLSPRKLIRQIELIDSATALELGPGPGYFSVPVARFLKNGRLFLADIQQEMLNHARRRLVKRGLHNVEYHKCDGNALPFPDNKFDVIYMVTVLGEIENRDAYIKEFHRILKPGGILAIAEQAGDPDKLSKADIADLLKDSGLVFYKDYGGERNFTVNYRKPASEEKS